jgi:hypothetical protein
LAAIVSVLEILTAVDRHARYFGDLGESFV